MIRLENVTKSYSTEVTALRDASFDVAKAEFVFLVGHSGSGKSTLLRLMNRQERPEKGAVWVAGRNINEMPDSKVPHLRRNIGIARRLAPLLDNDRRKIELLNSLVFTLPGSPIIYYGDEIGMGDNVHLGDRNGVRTPMQWSAAANAGFTSGDVPMERLFFFRARCGLPRPSCFSTHAFKHGLDKGR